MSHVVLFAFLDKERSYNNSRKEVTCILWFQVIFAMQPSKYLKKKKPINLYNQRTSTNYMNNPRFALNIFKNVRVIRVMNNLSSNRLFIEPFSLNTYSISTSNSWSGYELFFI